MNILNVFYNFDQGGVERLGISVANQIAKSGNESHVIIINDRIDDSLVEQFTNDVKVYKCIKSDTNRKLGYLKQIVRYIRLYRIDVMHVHQGTLMTFYALVKILCPNIRLFFTIHDTFIYSELSIINRIIANIVCNKLIAISDGVVENMRLHGAPMNKVIRIYNGVNFDRFSVKSTNEIDEVPVIANVARFYPQKKGQDILLFAVGELKKRGKTAEVFFAGGELKGKEGEIERMKLLASKLNIVDNVHFLGNVDNVNSVLSNANIFCIPSNYEGFGISAVEAMGTGLPCVATNIVGLNEVVNDVRLGETFCKGDFVDLADKLEKVITNIDLYDPCYISSDVRKRFSIEKMVSELLNIYV